MKLSIGTLLLMVLVSCTAHSGRSDEQVIADLDRKTCRAQMEGIANAIQASRVAAKERDFARYMGPLAGQTIEILDKSLTRCPGGGTYSVEQGSSKTMETYRIRCSVPEHGTFEPGVDNPGSAGG